MVHHVATLKAAELIAMQDKQVKELEARATAHAAELSEAVGAASITHTTEAAQLRAEHAQQVEQLEAMQTVLQERHTLLQTRAVEDAELLTETHTADVRAVCEGYEVTLTQLRRDLSNKTVDLAAAERQIADADGTTTRELRQLELRHVARTSLDLEAHLP
jgi:hypothetical protein